MSINGTLDIAEDCSLYGAGEYIEKCDCCAIINSLINNNLTATFKIINKLGWDLYD